VPNSNPSTWVLVCDASRARLLREENQEIRTSAGIRRMPFVMMEEFAHPESRAKNRNLVSDRMGRTKPSMGTGEPYAAKVFRTEPKLVEAQRFARELAERLSHGRDENAFNKLVIAAPPQFLGILRSTLEERIKNCVTDWIEKDYTQLDDWTLAERLEAERQAA
jgi:protein required for attachment to host cells